MNPVTDPVLPTGSKAVFINSPSVTKIRGKAWVVFHTPFTNYSQPTGIN